MSSNILYALHLFFAYLIDKDYTVQAIRDVIDTQSQPIRDAGRMEERYYQSETQTISKMITN